MLHTGIVSVTFRNLQAEEIVKLAAKAGLEAIEWGGDVHVPHGDIKKAREAYAITSEAGLKIASYGSYYEAGISREKGLLFEKVLETAVELHAPNIRIWAGNTDSRTAGEDYRNNITEEVQAICDAALKVGINISFEYHNNSLTDTPESTCRLMRDINRKNIFTYWQAAIGITPEERLESIGKVSPWLSNLHVYKLNDYDRLALAEGAGEWSKYLKFAGNIKGDRYCLLEFVKNDSPEQLLQDAVMLKNLLRAANLQ